MAGLLPFVGFSHCLCQASAFCFPLSRPHGKQTPRGRLLEDLVSGLFAQVKPQYTDWEKVHGKKLPPHQVRWSTQDLDTITCTDPWPNAPGGDGCRKLLHRPPHLWHRGESPLPYACPLCMSLMHVPYARTGGRTSSGLLNTAPFFHETAAPQGKAGFLCSKSAPVFCQPLSPSPSAESRSPRSPHRRRRR